MPKILLFSLMLIFVSGPVMAASIAQMAGQMIMIGFKGTSVDQSGVKAVRRDIAAGRIGGVIYLRSNVASLARVKAINAAFIAASGELKPFIALDQEGGRIERLTRAVGFKEIPSAARVAKTQSPEQAEKTYFAMASDLANLGFNVNFGPVVDLNINPANPIIGRYGRSFGVDANLVSQYGASFVMAHRRAGVLTALKHFPGHGSSRSDSHKGFVDISATWQARELDPYRNLIAAGLADMVMVGHLYHERFSSPGGPQLPASLSQDWIEGVLRDQLGFDGVVISDDMEMGAIRQNYSLKQAVILGVEAGVDILLFSNTADYRPGLASEIIAILTQEADHDPAFAARIRESYARIVALKSRL
ncbi:beta-glycosyl hydrolase [hydrothermal vent metagenome]|uniref:beta-N-acetylhexosaminidase n=1 Tax=hydrothermal vent metagenome TaxID=652676 RepID=A0A3B0TQ53_9ZZZZ